MILEMGTLAFTATSNPVIALFCAFMIGKVYSLTNYGNIVSMTEQSTKQEIQNELEDMGLSPSVIFDWWGLVLEKLGNDFDKEYVDDAVDLLVPILERVKPKSRIAISPSPSQDSLKKTLKDQSLMTTLKSNLDEPFEGIEIGIDAHNRNVLRFHTSISRRALKELIDNLPLGRLNMKLRALWEFVHAHGITKVTQGNEIKVCWVATLKKWNEFAPEEWQFKGKNPRAQFQIEYQRAEQALKEGGWIKGKWKSAGPNTRRLIFIGIEEVKKKGDAKENESKRRKGMPTD